MCFAMMAVAMLCCVASGAMFPVDYCVLMCDVFKVKMQCFIADSHVQV